MLRTRSFCANSITSGASMCSPSQVIRSDTDKCSSLAVCGSNGMLLRSNTACNVIWPSSVTSEHRKVTNFVSPVDCVRFITRWSRDERSAILLLSAIGTSSVSLVLPIGCFCLHSFTVKYKSVGSALIQYSIACSTMSFFISKTVMAWSEVNHGSTDINMAAPPSLCSCCCCFACSFFSFSCCRISSRCCSARELLKNFNTKSV
mmetsp:Transcript_2226/g.3628  ORF Transcript_2226/g.3628 Transcript_2226/m.3628 type:complete len:204 (-) Transcript_2226:224-835(-)